MNKWASFYITLFLLPIFTDAVGCPITVKISPSAASSTFEVNYQPRSGDSWLGPQLNQVSAGEHSTEAHCTDCAESSGTTGRIKLVDTKNHTGVVVQFQLYYYAGLAYCKNYMVLAQSPGFSFEKKEDPVGGITLSYSPP